MKKTLLASAIALAATTASAQQVLFSEDFNAMDATETLDEAWKLNNVVDYLNLSPMSILDDEGAHGKYVKIKPRSSGNAGAAVYYFNEPQRRGKTQVIKDKFGMIEAETEEYTLEFDAAINTTAKLIEKPAGSDNFVVQGCNSEIAVLSSATVLAKRVDYGLLNDNADNEFNNVAYFQQEHEREIEEKEVIDNYAADFSYKNMNLEGQDRISIPTDGTWCHYTFKVNRTTKEVSYTIAPENGEAISGEYGSLADELALAGIYFRVSCGDGDRDYVLLDNIKVTTDSATGIADVEAKSAKQDGTVYNLAGQVVKSAAKGIYIQNGKKFVAR